MYIDVHILDIDICVYIYDLKYLAKTRRQGSTPTKKCHRFLLTYC